jgi:hypothetical protein
MNNNTFELTDDNFLLACSDLNKSKINYFLDNKFIPTNKHFDAVVDSLKHQTDVQSLIIKKCVEYGYVITYDDAFKCIKKRIKIQGNVIFNFDDKFRDECLTHHYFPFDDNICSQIVLSLCCNCNYKPYDLKKIMKQHNVKPDIHCLREACKYYNNGNNVRLILSYGVNPDLKCLEYMMHNELGKNNVNRLILRSFVDTHDENFDVVTNDELFNDIIVSYAPKKQILMNEQLVQFYKLVDIKTVSSTFLEIKKNMLAYIITKKLFTDKCELSFIIDDKLSELFGLTRGLKIQMNEIDKFIGFVIEYKP